MSEPCEVVVYVRSERTVVAAQEICGVRPVAATLSGPLYVPVREAAVIYGRRLPRDHAAALTEASRLADVTHGAVHVVDLGRSNAVARAVRLWLLGEPALPAIVVKGACRWDRIGSDRAEPASRATGA